MTYPSGAVTLSNQRSFPRGVIFHAQMDHMSRANDFVQLHLAPQLAAAGFDYVPFRIWPVIKANRSLLAKAMWGAFKEHGFRAFRSKTDLAACMYKSTTMFDMASDLMRQQILATPNVVAILQTGGAFNSSLPGLPFFIHADDVILNREHGDFQGTPASSQVIDRERALYAHVDKFMVQSSHVVEALHEFYGIDRAKTAVINVGANARATHVDQSLERYAAQKIIFVGLDWDRKGGAQLVQAFEQVLPEFPKARLTIVGAAPVLSHPAIDVVGRLPLDGVGDALAQASIFCLPSRLEPSAAASVEASLAALPVIATDTGGFRDSVVEGITGLRVPVGDVDRLADALRRLLSDPALCQSIGAAGRTYAASHYVWESVTAKMANTMVAEVTAREPVAAKAVAA